MQAFGTKNAGNFGCRRAGKNYFKELESKDDKDEPSAISKGLAALFAPRENGKELEEYAVQEVLREKHNFDLLIVYKKDSDFRFAVVENKFKSIPDAEQLERYSEEIDGTQRYQRNGTRQDGTVYNKGDVKEGKNYIDISNELENEFEEAAIPENGKFEIKKENTTCYLLAPEKALKLFDNSKSEEWKSVPYEDVLEKIENNKETQNKDILENYVDFTRRMLVLSSDVAKISGTTRVYGFESVVKQLKPIRIHDFYEKLWFSAVMHNIKENISSDLSDIETSISYTRGMGILNFTYSPNEKDDICFGIQIQNKQFRVFVYPKNKDDKWKSEEEILNWLNSILGLQEAKLLKFAQFKYLPLDKADKIKDITVDELSNKIKEMLKKIKNEVGNFNAEIKNA